MQDRRVRPQPWPVPPPAHLPCLSPLHPHPPTLPAALATTLLKQHSGFLMSTDEVRTSGSHGQVSIHPDHLVLPSLDPTLLPAWWPDSPHVLISRPCLLLPQAVPTASLLSPRQNARTARAQPQSLSHLASALVHPGSGHGSGVRRPGVWEGL